MNANLELSWDEIWDAGAMGCGELVMILASKMRAMQPGEILKLIATDPGAIEDIPAWCRMTGHTLRSSVHPEYMIERRKG